MKAITMAKPLAALTLRLVTVCGGWYAGLVAYRLVAYALFQRHQSPADDVVVGVWILVGFAIVTPLVYIPFGMFLRAHIEAPFLRTLVGLLVGAAFGPIAGSLMCMAWGNGHASVLVSTSCLLVQTWAVMFGSGVGAAMAIDASRN
jgi:hypothetical protein